MKTHFIISKTIFSAVLAASMMLSSVSLFAQFKVGSNPTIIDPTTNFESESNDGHRFKINKASGKVEILDGSQGDHKVLTSDAKGVATWRSKSELRIDETVFIGTQAPGTHIVVTNWNNVFNRPEDRMPFVVRLGSLPGWDPNTKEYTIQEDGYYRVFAAAKITGTLPPPRVTLASLYLGPWHALNQYQGISNAVGPQLPVNWEGELKKGQVVTVWVTNNPLSGPDQHFKVSDSFLSITRLY